MSVVEAGADTISPSVISRSRSAWQDPAESDRRSADVTILVPAHNEADRLPATLTGLFAQTVRARRVIVVADNCTDATEDIAAAAGAEVIETVGNREMKAGALNQVLAGLLPAARPDAYVLVVDADTVIAPHFIESAIECLADPAVGAVGGVFVGEQGSGLLGLLQRSEYARYARAVGRKKGVAMVLTGTSTMFRVAALQRVVAERGRRLPGRRGSVYNSDSLTEDSEMTVALRSLGLRTRSPRACLVTTEVMPTPSTLWRQRVRWYRGALDNIRIYGVRRSTAPYIAQQVGLAAAVLAGALYLAVLAAAVVLGGFRITAFWSAIGGLFVLERLITARRAGPLAMLVGFVLVIEMAYDLFLQAAFIRSVVAIWRRQSATWDAA